MVVLEDGRIMATGSNQYLQPDYLSPLPSTLDSKKSPLALLAQTCSQIGADSTPSKLITSSDKKKSVNSALSDTVTRCSPVKLDKPRSTPENKHLAFKPYEMNVVTKKPDDRPSSKNSVESFEERKSGKQSPSRKTTPPSTAESEKSSPVGEQKSSSPATAGTSPIIRSGLEVLHGKDHLAAFKQGLPGLGGFNPLTGMYCPPGLEQHVNPAFRPPFAGAPFSAHQAAMLAAAGFPGASPSAYLSYARVKTPSGGESIVPVCKDPYCASCQFALHNHQMLLGNNGPCPSGCTQCDHQKYNLAMAMALSNPAVAAAGASNLPYSQLGKPYICNWIVGESYCGKRFSNSDELLQHLRGHTSDGSTPTSAAQASLMSSLNPLISTATLRGSYPSAPLSPLSANRYHPYSKTALPNGLPAPPYPPFNPAALGPFYSPYAMYGQRLGSAAVHQ